ncbi:MAG: LCP family protein [Bacilli bacterium]|nr:LCP family protein [Bacilli bacterium]
MAKKRSKKRLYRFISTSIFSLISILFVSSLFLLNLLPMYYMIGITIILLIISIGIIKLINSKLHALGVTLATILSLIYLVLSIYIVPTLIFFGGFREKVDYNYAILVLKDSNYNKKSDLKNKDVYVYKDRDDLNKDISKKVNTNVLNDGDFDNLIDKLDNKKIAAVVVDTSYLDMLNEENDKFMNNYKIIDKFTITKYIKKNKNNTDITKKPYNILITGIDTSGKVSGVARSDVNILVTVNPKDNKILLTSIPRDYYVEIKEGKTKDKLTHSGIYGVETTKYAVSKLLDTEIDYYIKVNFSSVVNIVDTLGGIEINSDTNFTSGIYEYNEKRFTFKQGKNKVNGKQALAFARERKSFVDGDRRRNIHQQEVIKGILNKVLEPNILVKYNSLLNTLSDSFITDMDSDDIKKIIKNQIKDNKKWEITNSYLTGKDGYESTYSYKAKLYVMIPDEDSVSDAQSKIKEFMKSN